MLIWDIVIAPVLQESDMFMDALMTASTKKEPRKRKRRTSISKDSDTKKSDGANSVTGEQNTRESSSPSSSPQGGDERSPLAVKPEFKVNIKINYFNKQLN